jgi:hypothetical protein
LKTGILSSSLKNALFYNKAGVVFVNSETKKVFLANFFVPRQSSTFENFRSSSNSLILIT